MKKTAVIALALAGLMLLVGCAGGSGGKNGSSSQDSSSPYSKEYLESIQLKLIEMEEMTGIGIITTVVDEDIGKVLVGVCDDSEEVMAKIELQIGKEAMDACTFGTGSFEFYNCSDSDYSYYDYSVGYLEIVKLNLEERTDEFGIVSIEISEKINRVMVSLKDDSDEVMSQIEDYLEELMGDDGMRACIFEKAGADSE